MTKKVYFKILIVLFVAAVFAVSGTSVSYAKWVKGNAVTAIGNQISIGKWTDFYGIVFLDANGKETDRLVTLVGDRDAQGNFTGAYTGAFTAEENERFKIYYNNRAVTSGLKGDTFVYQSSDDPSVYIARTATDSARGEKYAVTIIDGAFSIVKTPIDFSILPDAEINKLLDNRPGIVTGSGKIIPIPDFANGEAAEIELAAGEELVIMINGARAKVDLSEGLSQYSIVENENWEKGKGSNVVSVKEEGVYTVSIKGWLVGWGAKRVHIEKNKTDLNSQGV